MNWNFNKADLKDNLDDLTKHYKKPYINYGCYLNNNKCLSSIIQKAFKKLDINLEHYRVSNWCISSNKKIVRLGTYYTNEFLDKLYDFIVSIKPKYIVNKETAELYHVDFFDNDIITISITKGSETRLHTIEKKDLEKYKIISYE